jgi:hypothetical protein
MFRLALRPSPLGFVLGLALIALWALICAVSLAQLLAAPEKAARQARQVPGLARIESRPVSTSNYLISDPL